MPHLSSPIAAAAVFLLISAIFKTSFCSGGVGFFPNCDRTFTCGSLHNITYPFTGGDRPDYCGPPEFRLTCRQNSYAELTSNSVVYRVLEINQTQKSLVLARPDFSNNTCATKFVNSTLDSAIFTYHGVGNEDISLFYGCTHVQDNFTPHNRFSCIVRGVNDTDAYYLVGPVPDSLLQQSLIKCQVGVVILVTSDAAQRLINNQTTLVETLKEGFNVNYKTPYDEHCSNCTLFGRQCGIRLNSSEPICICRDSRPCNIPPPSGRNYSKQNTTNVVVPFISVAVLAGVVLGWCMFSWIHWRNDHATQSAKVKEISSLPSLSKGLTSPPSGTISRSMRSYRSAKAEFETVSTYFGVQIFSYAELEEVTDNFNPSKELGDGGFGTVYYGELQDGRAVAVKRLYENNFKRVEQFMNEVGILTGLSHDNLVKLYGCTSKQSRDLILVYEYIPNGTVAEHLHGNGVNSGFLSWHVRLNIAIETADALSYLHASDIIHRDVKTNNILLDNDFHVKVADFGLSRAFPNDASHISTAPQGTPGYVDPEYYQCYHLTDKSDVYSFGVVLIELISSKEAVDTKRDRPDIILANMAVNKIQNRRLHEMVDPHIGFETSSCVKRTTTQVAELAFRCLQTERDLRPSMKEVLEALRGIKNEHYPDTQKTEMVNIIMEDDAGDLKRLLSLSNPLSTAKWC